MPKYTETPEEHFLIVQATIFKDLLDQNEHIDKREFILRNAHLFRHFAEHLPDDLRESWSNADHNEQSRVKLENQYALFVEKIDAYIARLDPEIQNDLADAVRDGDINLVSYILENTFAKQ